MTLSQKDIRDVADLVAKKLELYMNQERRETRFSPLGAYRTTPTMHKYDLVYKVMEAVDLDQDSPRYKTPRSHKSRSPFRGGTLPHFSPAKSKSRSPSGKSRERKKERKKSKEKSKEKKRLATSPGRDSSSEQRRSAEKADSDKETADKKQERRSRQRKSRSHACEEGQEDKVLINPHVEQDSLRVIPNKEADRLTASANEILSEVPVDKLQVIHRYRPNASDIPNITENGKVQNYTRHVGSALHTTKYIDYYMQEGLQSGKREYSKRLQDLKGTKESDSRRRQESSRHGGRCNKRNNE